MPELFVTFDDVRASGLTFADVRGRVDSPAPWLLPEVATKLLTAQLTGAGFDVLRAIEVREKRDPSGFVLRQG